MSENEPSRRTILRSAAGALAAPVLTIPMPETPLQYRQETPLRELQQRFLDTRMGMFVHFNMATFQDREWGDPNGPADTFAPSALDCTQWAKAAKAAGMGYGCLTTKHHDGFPLWPTKTVKDKASVDVVRQFVDAFRAEGLRVALYFSILDLRQDVRHFNITPAKIRMIHRQLTELLTQYGEIDFLIIDGWDAPWSRITYQEIRFDEVYALIKSLQPNCLICDLNAAHYPEGGLYYGDLKAFEMNAGESVPAENRLPAIACVTLTNGWFWKSGDEARPLKATKQVVEEWLKPLNERHCNLIVNAAPGRDGKFAPNLMARLEEIGKAWKNPGPMAPVPATTAVTTRNLATGRPARATSSADTYGPDMAVDGRFSNSWYLPEGLSSGWFEVDLAKGTMANQFVLVEPVHRWKDYDRSRIRSWKLSRWVAGGWEVLASGGEPHSVEMVRFPRVKCERIRLDFEAAAPTPHIAEIGIYDEPS